MPILTEKNIKGHLEYVKIPLDRPVEFRKSVPNWKFSNPKISKKRQSLCAEEHCLTAKRGELCCCMKWKS